MCEIKAINFPSEYNGIYSFDKFNGTLEGGRPVFQRNGKCVWWHRLYRHWWVGPCENVGKNTGFAYAKEHVDCPSYEQTWWRGGSNTFLNDVHVYIPLPPFAPQGNAYLADWSSSIAGVNIIIRKGQYKRTCKPVYKNGKFKCS